MAAEEGRVGAPKPGSPPRGSGREAESINAFGITGLDVEEHGAPALGEAEAPRGPGSGRHREGLVTADRVGRARGRVRFAPPRARPVRDGVRLETPRRCLRPEGPRRGVATPARPAPSPAPPAAEGLASSVGARAPRPGPRKLPGGGPQRSPPRRFFHHPRLPRGRRCRVAASDPRRNVPSPRSQRGRRLHGPRSHVLDPSSPQQPSSVSSEGLPSPAAAGPAQPRAAGPQPRTARPPLGLRPGRAPQSPLPPGPRRACDRGLLP